MKNEQFKIILITKYLMYICCFFNSLQQKRINFLSNNFSFVQQKFIKLPGHLSSFYTRPCKKMYIGRNRNKMRCIL
ncbi:hypothetical protein BpHYR1_039493 [Brachionus plicatilis]|uniref:Uncharacterized protein n=1 Tax=Brachionus plicatilis TaxID=10195 RepID=A0A3M7PCD5_BRAPC|nr:hypothetical protein BpHYR1_039493 [Brachionus plicatilis]